MGWKLRKPIFIGGSLAKSRIVMAPMVTRLSTISSAGESLVYLLQRQKVRILSGHTALEIGVGQLVTEDADGVARTIVADTVILATGIISRAYKELTGIIPNTACIGDCKEARKIY